MSYGQSIAKKVVWDKTSRLLTKAAYCHLLSKALVSAGMTFLPSVSEYDFLDPRNEEGDHDIGGQYSAIAFFDFPTSEVFTVNSINYRPYLALRYSGDTYDPTNSNGMAIETVSFELGVRRADRLDPNDFRTYNYYRYSSGYWGMGGSTEGWAGANDGAWFYDHKWLPSYRPEWASFPSSYGWRPITVGNVFVHLGPGGLIVCTGQDPSASGFSSVHAFAVVFYGSRIPGRAYNPIVDVNLPRCNPTVMIPFRSVDGEFLTTPGNAQLIGHILGCQYNLQFTPTGTELVHWYHYNMENVDRPLFPDLFATVRNSPRVVSGSGRHILAPMIGIPNNRRGNATELYSKVDQNISATRVSPPWEDFFYAPNARLADATAPIGEYEDPVSLLNWWLVPMTNTGARLAMNVEGATSFASVPAVASPVLQTTEQYDGSVAGDASAFPRTTTFLRDTNGPGSGNFAWVSGQNILRASYPMYAPGGYFRRTRLRILMTPFTYDPAYQYVLKYELTVRSTMATAPTTTGNSPYFYIWLNNPFGNASIVRPFLAGRSAGENAYNSQTVEQFVVPSYGNNDPGNVLQNCINIGLHAFDPTSVYISGVTTIEVSNLRIEIQKR